MRRSAVRVMSGLTLVVVGASLRASRLPAAAALGAQPAGVVAGAPLGSPAASQAALPTHRPLARASAAARATTSPRATGSPAATRPAATSPSSRRTASPRPAAATRVAAKPSPTAPATVTVNGAPADTQYGPVQVQISVRGGHIVAARALEYPSGSSRDQDINSQAIPQLDDEAVQADSAAIDTVSGATYTSDGYRQSLQSALDAAHQAGAR